MTIIAAADGSALGNPGPAGWAWYIDDERWRCGGWSRGTNNQGELTAVLDLLRQTAHSPEPLHILCDSQYVINSVTKWMAGWKRKGWKKADGKPVLNVEVMKALDEAMRGRRVTFEWVKGHTGHELNEKADELASGAARAHASRDEPTAGPGFPGARSVGAGDDPATPPGADGDSRQAGAKAPAAQSAAASGDAEPDLFSMGDDSPAPGSSTAGSSEPGSSEAGSSEPAVDQVLELERSLFTDAVRGDREKLTALLDPSWSHVCARGEVWSLQDRLAAADSSDRASPDRASPDRAHGERPMELIEAREVGAETVLLVWRDRSGDGSILRSSVWVRSGGSWRQTFQQGTREG